MPAVISRDTQPDAQNCLKMIRLLAEAFFGFESFNRSYLKQFGLTSAQFDIVATLANTSGMTFRELGDKTLITKGTLTGVVDRLSAMGLVQRVAGQADRRTTKVVLTAKGSDVFTVVHPAIVGELRKLMQIHGYSNRDFTSLSRDLVRLRGVFRDGQSTAHAA